ncbi:1-acyl-sn-glycerol-3-phosphate acyltransferase [Candidatus Woesearchaeota archaeon]|nr:1-acyl-sn-glycerol-3-phosphate acyltransferase [Candidatus Woesearchaeota archaeon]
MGARQLDVRIIEAEPPASRRWLMRGVTWMLEKAQPLFTEEVHVRGLENLVREDGTPLPSPHLYIMKHESWYDVLNGLPLWRKLPAKPPVRIGIKDFTSSQALNAAIWTLFSFAAFPIRRVSAKEGLTDSGREELRAKNRATLGSIRDSYLAGYSAGILPEGTSKTDGRIPKIHAGAYNISHIPHEGHVESVRVVPVGTTYDFMAGAPLGKRHRNLVFFAFGEPFTYRPVRRLPADTDEAWVRRDIATFAERIKGSFLDLSTITASMLGARFLYDLAGKGQRGFRFGDLYDAISHSADALGKAGIAVDPRLYGPDEGTVNRDGLFLRTVRFYRRAAELGYLDATEEGATIVRRRLYERPKDGSREELKRYKHDLVLQHARNRLDGIIRHAPEAGAAYREVRQLHL